MKKVLCLCIALLLAFSACGLAAFAARSGDVNDDNSVTAADARAILRAAVGLEKLSSEKERLADLDMDGEITAADARTALRIAVDLDRAADRAYVNEYDILRSGHYYTEFESDGDAQAEHFTLAFTDNTSYISVNVDNLQDVMPGMTGSLTLSLLFNSDGKTYLMEHSMKSYGEFPFKELGMDPGEVTGDFFLQAFQFMRPLSEADSTHKESYKGVNCTAYKFYTLSGSYKAYLNGKKLVAITEYDADGKELSSYDFKTVSLAVPSECCSLPASYQETDAIELLLLLMVMASSVPV